MRKRAGCRDRQQGSPPTLLADAGVENVNTRVDDLVSSGALRRILAMTEIAFSNSMIESLWRALKHQWLYLNTLDTVSSLRGDMARDRQEAGAQ